MHFISKNHPRYCAGGLKYQYRSVFSSSCKSSNSENRDDSDDCKDDSRVTGVGGGLFGSGRLGYFGFLNGVGVGSISILDNGVGAVFCCEGSGSLIGADKLIVDGFACGFISENSDFAACKLVSSNNCGEAIGEGCTCESVNGVVVSLCCSSIELNVVNDAADACGSDSAGVANVTCIDVVLADVVNSVYV